MKIHVQNIASLRSRIAMGLVPTAHYSLFGGAYLFYENTPKRHYASII